LAEKSVPEVTPAPAADCILTSLARQSINSAP